MTGTTTGGSLSWFHFEDFAGAESEADPVALAYGCIIASPQWPATAAGTTNRRSCGTSFACRMGSNAMTAMLSFAGGFTGLRWLPMFKYNECVFAGSMLNEKGEGVEDSAAAAVKSVLKMELMSARVSVRLLSTFLFKVKTRPFRKYAHTHFFVRWPA